VDINAGKGDLGDYKQALRNPRYELNLIFPENMLPLENHNKLFSKV